MDLQEFKRDLVYYTFTKMPPASDAEQLMMFTDCYSRNKIPTLTKVKVTKSSIHGVGVVATQVIKKGEVVTIYPSHGAGEERNGELFLAMPGSRPEYQKMVQDMGYDTMKYEFVQGKLHMLGLPSVRFPIFLGHLINDGSDISSETKYWATFVAQNNTAFNVYKKICYVQAMRDIQPGEELTVAYGTTYWQQFACGKCGNWKAAKKCGKCLKTCYCSRQCQVAHWKVHKKGCVKCADL